MCAALVELVLALAVVVVPDVVAVVADVAPVCEPAAVVAEAFPDFVLGAVVADAGPVFVAPGCVELATDVVAGVDWPFSLAVLALVLGVDWLVGTFGVLGLGTASFTVGTAVGLGE